MDHYIDPFNTAKKALLLGRLDSEKEWHHRTDTPTMGARRSSTWPHHLPLLFFLVLVNTSHTTTINITNRCPYTVWPAATPVGGGMQLEPGKSWVLQVPGNTQSGLVWARTGCSFDGHGNMSCETGDCGGVLACASSGQPPFTRAEFSLGGLNNTDFFDMNLIGGFNVPMDFLPVPSNGSSGCSRGPRCPADITSQCPGELKVPGGCRGACQHCNGSTVNSNTVFYVRMCPDAYSYSLDQGPIMYVCPSGTDYQIIFCPPVDLVSLSPPPITPLSPPPTPTSPTANGTSSITSSSKSKNRSLFGFVLGGSLAGFIFIASLALFFILHRRRLQRRQEMQEEEEAEFGRLPGMPRRFTFEQLQDATDQFREKLGEGGFGSVFKGRFGEEAIAVKRLDRSGQGKREFLAEVQTIGSIHHINLVRVIGFCAEKTHRLLVYEYMPKGSLDQWTFHRQGDDETPRLHWQTRRKIIAHIAKGLSYLHEECMKRVAHLDVKPQNILLDDNFDAKLSDFGLCKLIDREKSQVVTRMRGTPGYLAPEWLTSHITEKADVYSFGVVVMEIVSGRKNLDTSRSEKSIHLITLLEENLKNDRLVDLIDMCSSSDSQAQEQEAIQMIKLAMWCLQIDCKRRPKMSEVVKVLEGTISAETDIDHNFVVTHRPSFDAPGIAGMSAAPLASEVSGPR
jgi:predicted Ser/Thr protein kinase